MTYGALAPDEKIKIAEYAHTAWDIKTLLKVAPFHDTRWQTTYTHAQLLDQIDLFSESVYQTRILNGLIANITTAQPEPSTSRDTVLAHFLKRVIHTLADKDGHDIARWHHREFARDARLMGMREDLDHVHRTIVPLATQKAQNWFKETGLCALLSLETMHLMPPVRPERLWSILQRVESEVTSVKAKSAVMSDVVGALRETMNTGENYTTKDIALRVLELLGDLPAKHQVTILKELMNQRNVFPVGGRSDVFEALLPIVRSLPAEYQLSASSLTRGTLSRSDRMSAAKHVIEFADILARDKWIESLDRLIALTPPDTQDRAAALGALAVRCAKHAIQARQSDEDPALHDTTYLGAFRKLILAVDAVSHPHFRFLALISLQSQVMPGPKYAEMKQICANRAAQATAHGEKAEAIQAYMLLFKALQRS